MQIAFVDPRGLSNIVFDNLLIKDRYPDMEVIMLTGHGDMDLAIESLKFQATDFISSGLDGGMFVLGKGIDACEETEPVDTGQRITLSVGTSTDGSACYRVADTCCGMDEVTKARLFQRFFTTKGVRDTGIGLMLTRAIVHTAMAESSMSPHSQGRGLFSPLFCLIDEGLDGGPIIYGIHGALGLIP